MADTKARIDLREELAAVAHQQWSAWMKYQFEKGYPGLGGSWSMPGQFVDRWKRQMNTPYADLPEAEKVSDREEADLYLAVLRVDDAKKDKD